MPEDKNVDVITIQAADWRTRIEAAIRILIYGKIDFPTAGFFEGMIRMLKPEKKVNEPI